MPRQSRGPAPAPKRPTAAPARPSPQQPAQARQASSVAAPPAQAQQAPPAQAPPAQSSGGSGLFGQMASTAAGVAVGSSIGHAVGGWFGGGSSTAAAPADQPVAQTEQGAALNSNYQAPKVCETDVNNFQRCMNENQGSLTICSWYLDQLKSCQAAASQY